MAPEQQQERPSKEDTVSKQKLFLPGVKGLFRTVMGTSAAEETLKALESSLPIAFTESQEEGKLKPDEAAAQAEAANVPQKDIEVEAKMEEVEKEEQVEE